MTLVDGFAPPLPLQAMLAVRKTNEKKTHWNSITGIV